MSTQNSHNSSPASIAEYLNALASSPKYGPQVVCKKHFDERPPRHSPLHRQLPPQLQQWLAHKDINLLYSHQAKAIGQIQSGNNVVVATPTASGKSMIYNLPVMEHILKHPQSRALYLFPLKALAQDQLRILLDMESQLYGNMEENRPPLAAIYDGDTSPYQRRKIRHHVPSILISNPEMVHLSFLPYHSNWVEFFANLRFIVIDEIHTYRGIFGSHMGWVLRRLRRIANHYGSDPVFIMLSATVGNPQSLGEKLIDAPVHVITESGAPTARKNIFLINPWDSAAFTASQLLEAALKRGLRTIVYTQSRKMTEIITLWTRPKLGDLAHKLSSYRAGFLPEERREIEQQLTSGDLLGVISTSALELGIDIGDLDLCILVGYPGSIMATSQRGGRVGRGMRESAVVLLAQEDALDQHFMRNPDDFFRRDVESAVLNPDNPAILHQHLHCAAAELPLSSSEALCQNDCVTEGIRSLCMSSIVLESSEGGEYFATRKYPQRLVSLRGSGEQLTIIQQDSGEILGEIDSGRALKECHPGALYLHRARTWLIASLDLPAREVVARGVTVNYHTRAMSNKQTEILSVMATKVQCGCRVSIGKLKVTERVEGYQKRNNGTNKLIATYPLDLPEQTFETEGLWIEIPPAIQQAMESQQLHFMGALHAMEHTMIAMFPLLVLCDRNDIGGISCPTHEQTGQATIFIYDGHPGGVGLSQEAFHKMERLLHHSEKTIRSCECELGCPSCVHSPKCGSGNRPIDKGGCLTLLQSILALHAHNEESQPLQPHETHPLQSSPAPLAATENTTTPAQTTIPVAAKKGLAALPARYGVFDLETIRSAEEVGGWHRADRMGVSVGVIYDSLLDGYVTYLEGEVDNLISHLLELDLVIGFNNKRFDNAVLSGYTRENLHSLPTVDILEVVKERLGYRLSLDGLAEHTLGVRKSANGLQALQWYKEGKIDLICRYCKDDVQVTKDLFLHGLENGFFLFKNKAGRIVRLPIDLEQAVLNNVNAP